MGYEAQREALSPANRADVSEQQRALVPDGAPVQRQAKPGDPSVKGTSAVGKPIEEQKGEAFIKGADDALDIDPNDVEQNQLGDCWLLAGLMALASSRPELIRKMVKPAGAGKWTVTFHFPASGGGFEAESVTVDAKVPVAREGGAPWFAQVGDVDGGHKELWGLLVEKAYAETRGKYADITGARSPADHNAMEMVTGKRSGSLTPASLAPAELGKQLRTALVANAKGVTAWTISDDHDNARRAEKHEPTIVLNHGYALTDVSEDGTTVTLMNPWGRAWDLKGFPVEELETFFREIRISG